MMRKIARCAFASAGAVLLALAFAAGPLHADLGGPSTESWARLLNYGACALSIASAVPGVGLVAAVVSCAYILVIEM